MADVDAKPTEVNATILDAVLHQHGYHTAVRATAQAEAGQIDAKDVYRTGDFGIIGKVNVRRGKKWLLLHAGCSLLMFILTIIGTVLQKHYIGELKNVTLGYIWAASVLGVTSAGIGAYFFWYLPTLRHPYAVLVTLRLLAIFNYVPNAAFGWLFTILVAIAGKENFVGLSDSEIEFLNATYAMITIIMVLESVISCAFFYAWWSACPICPDACKCCAVCCIYERPAEASPETADPPTSINILRVAEVLAPLSEMLSNIA